MRQYSDAINTYEHIMDEMKENVDYTIGKPSVHLFHPSVHLFHPFFIYPFSNEPITVLLCIGRF